MSKITVAEFERVAADHLPFVVQLGYRVESLEPGRALVRAPYREDFLRPGGTISGPVLMGLADYAMFAAVLTLIGRADLAVTTNLNINFLRRPLPGDVIADALILKLGKRLAVGEVELFSAGDDQPVALVTATYVLPDQDEDD